MATMEGKATGRSYQAVSNYVNGKRVPQTKEEREKLAELFKLNSEERADFLNLDTATARPVTESLTGVTAAQLKIRSFTDIMREYFSEKGAPSRVTIFATGEPLALTYRLIRQWLNDYLMEPDRELIYVFPPPVPGADHIQKLNEIIGSLSFSWKSPLIGVVSCTIDREADEDRERLRTFTQLALEAPLPLMFRAFGLGPVIFVLEGLEQSDKSTVSFTTLPVHESFYDQLKNRTDSTHPPTLWVQLDSIAERAVEMDLKLLRMLIDRAPTQSGMLRPVYAGEALDRKK